MCKRHNVSPTLEFSVKYFCVTVLSRELARAYCGQHCTANISSCAPPAASSTVQYNVQWSIVHCTTRAGLLLLFTLRSLPLLCLSPSSPIYLPSACQAVANKRLTISYIHLRYWTFRILKSLKTLKQSFLHYLLFLTRSFPVHTDIFLI